MKIAGEYRFNLPRDVVWDGIFDPEILAASLPGCENLEHDGDIMRGELVVKMGPVRGKFKGTVEFLDVDAPSGCTLKVDGKGTSGFVKATATIELEEVAGGTLLKYESDSKIGGKIASVGQRLLGASARAISKQSLESLNETLTDLAEQESTSSTESVPTSSTESVPTSESIPASEFVSATATTSKFVSATTTTSEFVSATATELVSVTEVASASATESVIASTESSKPKHRNLKKKSQRAFAAGVAKEIANDVFPFWLRVAIGVAVLAFGGWLVFRFLG